MLQSTLVLEQRRHSRAQLHLPVRLRWLGPLGTRLEVCQTHDASRNGLLFYRSDACAVGARIWITFPFDAATTEPQPEIAARVVRVTKASSGGHRVAVNFDAPRNRVDRPIRAERRAGPRIPLVIPLWLRFVDTPWPEEAMTLDVSTGGVRFETLRLCTPGAEVRARLAFGELSRADESPAHVVRIESVPGAAEQQVSIAWGRAAKS